MPNIRASQVSLTKCVELPFFLLDSNIELLNALERELVLLHENADGVSPGKHEQS